MGHHDSDGYDEDESQKWVNIACITIGGIVLMLMLVIAFICYKQTEKRVQNRVEMNNAMKATIENVDIKEEIEVTVTKHTETKSNSSIDYEGGMENVIR